MQTKQCTQCSKTFRIDDQDVEFYKKVAAPEPEYCPLCRRQRRYAYRNERTLFANQCGLCHKNLLSIFNLDSKLMVYCQACWNSDKWDATEYGLDIDWDRSLLQQYQELRRSTPQLALIAVDNENSDYVNGTAYSKNCYLLFASEDCDNCSYGKLVQNSRDCFDSLFVYDSELCYNCINVRNCYRGIYLQDCQDSKDCGFSVNLKGCSNVWLSSNLQNKQYYIRNKAVTPDEYEHEVKKLTQDYAAIQTSIVEWRNLNNKRVTKYTTMLKSEASTGDFLTECGNVLDSFDVTRGQNCRYITDAMDPIDSYDASFIYYKPELIYDTLGALQSYNIQYSTYSFYCRDSLYCDQIHNSTDLCLSANVRNKHFLILNKQYTEAEYKELLPKIIAKLKQDGEYGHIPDMKYSLFAYNETVAQEYFPLTASEAKARGLYWNEMITAPYADDDVILAKDLPTTIGEVNDDILQQKVKCEQSGKAFKITKPELEFYRTLQLPLPHLHPESRHQWRMSLRNQRILWTRQCMCTQPEHQHKGRCVTEFATTYSPSNLEIVYCEDCYNKEMY